jgi:type IV pilus modification protein PilV
MKKHCLNTLLLTRTILSNNARGMSLVEILVALVIFSVGALAVLTMTTGSFKINSHSEAVDIASNLARRQMETILSMNYAELSDITGDGVNGLADNHHKNPSTPLDSLVADYSATLDSSSGLGLKRNYDIFWNIASDAPEPWTKTVTVIVEWQGLSGQKQVVFRTIRTE